MCVCVCVCVCVWLVLCLCVFVLSLRHIPPVTPGRYWDQFYSIPLQASTPIESATAAGAVAFYDEIIDGLLLKALDVLVPALVEGTGGGGARSDAPGASQLVVAELCGGEGRLAAKVLTRFQRHLARYQLLESNATLAEIARGRCAVCGESDVCVCARYWRGPQCPPVIRLKGWPEVAGVTEVDVLRACSRKNGGKRKRAEGGGPQPTSRAHSDASGSASGSNDGGRANEEDQDWPQNVDVWIASGSVLNRQVHMPSHAPIFPSHSPQQTSLAHLHT
jgi:hypothetical protein